MTAQTCILRAFLAIAALLTGGLVSCGCGAEVTNAGDDDPCTFTASIPCAPAEVASAYGRKYVIRVDGIDVCSWEYAAREGFSRPRRPVYQDLSDAAGWPRIPVKSGTVAIDPGNGRFRFAPGDTHSGIELKHFVMTPHGFAFRPTIRGQTMIVPDGETWSGIRVVDISDLAHPRGITTIDVGCTGHGAPACDGRMYCCTSYYGVTILDISKPAAPRKLGRWRVPPPSHHGYTVRPFTLGGKRYFYAFVKPDGNWKDWPAKPAKPKRGLRLVDVTDPAHPRAQLLEGVQMPLPAFVQGKLAYTGKGIFDISAPASPRLVTPVGKYHIVGREGKLVVALTRKSLLLLDGDHQLALLGRYDQLFAPRSVLLNGTFAYVLHGRNALVVLDISNPAAITKRGVVKFQRGRGQRWIVSDPMKRVAAVDAGNYGFGVYLLDLGDKARPRIAGKYFCAGEIQHLLVDEDQALATASLEWGGVQAMLDISDPLKAKIVGYYHSGSFDQYADVLRGKVMLFGGHRKDGTRTVVNVSDPSRPREAGTWNPGIRPFCMMKLWKDTGYAIGAAAAGKGKGPAASVLVSYDFSDPRHPRQLGRCRLAESAFVQVTPPKGKPSRRAAFHALATDGKLLVAAGPDRLVTVDVSDPAAPRVLGMLRGKDVDPYGGYKWQGSGRRLGLRRGYVYGIRGSEAADDPRIAVYDVRDPARPRCVYVTPESVPTFGDDWFDSRLLHQGDMFNDLVIEGRYMYVCDYWGGVRVYDLVKPEKPVCVDWQFTPYLALMPKTWNRKEYWKVAGKNNSNGSGENLHAHFGLTPQKWARRMAIGSKMSWTKMAYHPGYELFAWNIGELVGDYLCQPKLGGVAVYRLKRSPEAPRGRVSVQAPVPAKR